jgi:hypothetical protein
MITAKNPKTEAMAKKILHYGLSNPGDVIIPMFFQPCMGIDASVSAAIRLLKKENMIEQKGVDGCGKPCYMVTATALKKYHGFA